MPSVTTLLIVSEHADSKSIVVIKKIVKIAFILLSLSCFI